MFDSVRITTWLFIPFLLFLKVSSLKIKLFKNFQGCFTVQLSRFLSCFSVVSLPEQLWYHITAFSVCQQLFSTFLFLFIGAVLISEVCIRLFLCLCGVFRSDVLHNTTTFLRCQHLFLKFFNFLYFIFYIYFLYISDYFICIPVWPVEMFYIIGRFSFFYVLLCASMCFYVLLSAKFLYKSVCFFRTFLSFSPVAFFLFGIWFSFYCYLFKKLFHRKPAKINVFTYSLFLIPYIKSIFFSNFQIATILTHESTLYD